MASIKYMLYMLTSLNTWTPLLLLPSGGKTTAEVSEKGEMCILCSNIIEEFSHTGFSVIAQYGSESQGHI